MRRMRLAIAAELLDFNTVWIVFLVLHARVISLLAICASERNDHTHLRAPPLTNKTS